MNYYVGIDLGGTNIAVGVVDEEYRIVGKANTPTALPRSPEAIADSMAETARAAIKDAGLTMEDISYVGIGTPGSTNSETGMVEYANNLNFNDVPLQKLMEERIQKPTYLENDANAAAYGEAIAGAAKGYKDVVAITLGTGVGGGIIIDHKIVTGCSYAGAELGHTGMVYEGKLCGCGRKGCVEAYCSASALIEQTKEAMQAHKDSKMWEVVGGDLEKTNGKTAFDAMRMGDKVGTAVVDQYLDYLAYAVVNIVNLLQPQILLLGGGICKEGEILLKPLRKAVEEHTYCKDQSKNTKLATATLGNNAGIIGAAFLFQLHQK